MTEYGNIDKFRSGLIEKLLKTSYQRLIDYFPDEKQRFYSQWEKEDYETFSNPDTIGKHVLFTCISNNPIGYFSWDDRQYPMGIIGQNCILPEYQGQGYGRKQIEKIVKIFKDKNFSEIKATTGDHDFFISAQKMYAYCGFQELRKWKGDLFNLIEFSKQIL